MTGEDEFEYPLAAKGRACGGALEIGTDVATEWITAANPVEVRQ